jgi:hypothetical protein
VIVINDEPEDFSGSIRLLLKQGDREVVVDEANCLVPAVGATRLFFAVSIPKDLGIYELISELPVPQGEPVRSVRQFPMLRSSDNKTRP